MSKKKHKHKHKTAAVKTRAVTFFDTVLQSIRQHARSSPHAEICGVLIGRQNDAETFVIGAIQGEGATQGGSHVTFTQNTWVRIHEEKELKYSGKAIVGWYHSHPGFGVFLSDQDVFIHKNFFSEPGSVAWVYDPHSEEEGCFGWSGREVRCLNRYEVVSKTSQDNVPKNIPASLMKKQKSQQVLRFAIWRSSRILRALLIGLVTIVFVLLAGLGLQAVWRSSLFEWTRLGGKQSQINRSVESDAVRTSQQAKDSRATEPETEKLIYR